VATTPGGVVTTLAGSGAIGFADGTGSSALFTNVNGMAFSSRSGNLYIADTGNHRVRCVSTSTRVVTTLVGNGTAGFADGTGTNAMLNGPTLVAVDPVTDNVFVFDSGNFRLRVIVNGTLKRAEQRRRECALHLGTRKRRRAIGS
jgi:DNA-binding beta-propeller fold protein YncE